MSLLLLFDFSPHPAFEPTQTNITAVQQQDNIVITEQPITELIIID